MEKAPCSLSEITEEASATLLQTASETPAGLGFFGSYTAALDTAETYRDGTPASASIKVFGHDSDDLLSCVGCVPMGIDWDFPIDGPATMTITWFVTSWTETGSGGAPSVISWPFAAPEAIVGGNCACVWGTTAVSPRVIQDLKISLGLSLSPVKDYNSPQNVRNVFRTDCKPRVSFKVLRDVSEEPTEWAALTSKPWTFWSGSRPGKMYAFCVPNAMIEKFPGFADGDGAIMAEVVLYPGYYDSDTGSSALADTIFRMAIL